MFLWFISLAYNFVVLLSNCLLAFVSNSVEKVSMNRATAEKHNFILAVSINSRSQPEHLVSSVRRNRPMRGDTCHTESCHSHVDRPPPDIDKAEQKYKAFHAWTAGPS